MAKKKKEAEVVYQEEPVSEQWEPIARFEAYDRTGDQFLSSMSPYELQQEKTTRAIRTVRV